jgi:hypothetical protein
VAELVYHIRDSKAFLTWGFGIAHLKGYIEVWVDAWDAQHIVDTWRDPRQGKRSLSRRSSGPADAEFLVYPWEVENPDEGSRKIVSNPCEFC